MARLLWNSHADVNQAIGEFHQAYYGKAAGPMREYFELMQKQVRMPPAGLGRHIWIYDGPGAPYLNEEFLARASELFRQAEAAADTDDIRARVRKARLGIDYVQLTRAKKFTVEGEWYRPADLNGLEERWNTFVAGLRRFGITNLSESSPLTRDDQDFRTFVRPYRVATLENDRLRVHVAPELGGRVTHIIDKRSGRDLLLRPEPGAKQYPNLGGLTVAPYPDYVARSPWSAKWDLDPGATSTEAWLTGVCENGLKMRRRLWLEGSLLRTRTVLENAGRDTIEALLQSRWEVDPGPLESARVLYRTEGGAAVAKVLIEPERQPAGTESYGGADQPDGEWRVTGGAGVPAMVNRFPKEQVARCFLDFTAKSANRVGLAVASHRSTLKPGDRLTLEADYGID